MVLDLEVIDSHLTLIICSIDIFAPWKALWRRAWEYAKGGEEQLLKAGREILMLHVCRWGKQGQLVVVISFIGRSQNREREPSLFRIIASKELDTVWPYPTFGCNEGTWDSHGDNVPTLYTHVKKPFSPPPTGAHGQVSWELSKFLGFPMERETFMRG